MLMKRWIATLVVSLLAVVGSLFVASPAHATWNQCASGFFCMWNNNDASGSFVAYQLAVIRAEGGIDLPANYDNWANSFWNRTSRDIVIFDNANCYLSGWHRYMQPNRRASGADWANRVSSIADPTRRDLPC
jgi:hypothetical protein